MGGGKDGGGGAPVINQQTSEAAERLANIQADQAQQLFAESTPIRQRLLNEFGQSAGASEPIDFNFVTQNPAFGALKDATETNFDLARDRLISNTPAGGALFSGLGNIERGRAGALTSGVGVLSTEELARRERMQDRALSAATGLPAISVGGLGGATNAFTQLAGQQAAAANAAANRDAGKASGLGNAAGSIAGAAMFKSSREYKKEIHGIEVSEGLALVLASPIYHFRYKAGAGPAGPMIGPMAEETAPVLLSRDGKSVNLYSMVGALMASVQALNERLESLEARI